MIWIKKMDNNLISRNLEETRMANLRRRGEVKEFVEQKIKLINIMNLPQFYPKESFEEFQLGYKINAQIIEKRKFNIISTANNQKNINRPTRT